MMTYEQKVYLNAAKLVLDGRERFSCTALGEPGTEYRRRYQLVMLEGSDDPRRLGDLDTHSVPPEVRDLRVLLLCMMAACCSDVYSYIDCPTCHYSIRVK